MAVGPFLLLSLLLQLVPNVSSYSVKSYPYMYPGLNDAPNSSFPIFDYHAPEVKRQKELYHDEPDFLYKPNPKAYRVIQYYTHWCAKAHKIKAHYQAVSKRIYELGLRQNVTIEFYAVSCTPNKFLCRNQGITGYPKIVLFEPGQTKDGFMLPGEQMEPARIFEQFGLPIDEDSEDAEWDLEAAVAKEANNRLEAKRLAEGDEVTTTSLMRKLSSWLGISKPSSVSSQGRALRKGGGGEDANDYTIHHGRTRHDMKNDIHMSLDFALRHSVFVNTHGSLPEDRKLALRTFLLLMAKTIPQNWMELHHLVQNLLRDMNYIIRSEEYLIGVLDDHKPKTDAWSHSCSHGDPHKGFSCGLWTLFHAMTVGTYEYNQFSDKKLATGAVAESIKDFIVYFFNCDECREKFVKDYNSCRFDRCTRLIDSVKKPKEYTEEVWMELPLWLHEVHNGVNVRILQQSGKDFSQDQLNQVKWPSKEQCRTCLASDAGSFETYDKTNVFKFLMIEYGQRDEKLLDFRKDIVRAYAERRAMEIEESEKSFMVTAVAFQVFVLLAGMVVLWITYQTRKRIQINFHHHKSK